jgi:hypothetical protein
MELSLELYSGSKLALGADIAYKSNLFVPGWAFESNIFPHMIAGIYHKRGIDSCLLIISDRTRGPVCCVVTLENEFHAYTKPEFRRKGIATIGARYLLPKTQLRPSSFHCEEGEEGTRNFFLRLGLPCWVDHTPKTRVKLSLDKATNSVVEVDYEEV